MPHSWYSPEELVCIYTDSRTLEEGAWPSHCLSTSIGGPPLPSKYLLEWYVANVCRKAFIPKVGENPALSCAAWSFFLIAHPNEAASEYREKSNQDSRLGKRTSAALEERGWSIRSTPDFAFCLTLEIFQNGLPSGVNALTKCFLGSKWNRSEGSMAVSRKISSISLSSPDKSPKTASNLSGSHISSRLPISFFWGLWKFTKGSDFKFPSVTCHRKNFADLEINPRQVAGAMLPRKTSFFASQAAFVTSSTLDTPKIIWSLSSPCTTSETVFGFLPSYLSETNLATSPLKVGFDLSGSGAVWMYSRINFACAALDKAFSDFSPVEIETCLRAHLNLICTEPLEGVNKDHLRPTVSTTFLLILMLFPSNSSKNGRECQIRTGYTDFESGSDLGGFAPQKSLNLNVYGHSTNTKSYQVAASNCTTVPPFCPGLLTPCVETWGSK